MTLNFDFPIKILTAVENHYQSSISPDELLLAVGIDKGNDRQIDRFYHHIRRISEIGFLKTRERSYEITMAGYKFLEASASSKSLVESTKCKCFAGLTHQEIKIRFPALLIDFLMNSNFWE